MVPLPKRKISKARQGKRRHAIKLTLVSLTKCPSCQQPKLPHRVCLNCGSYKDKVVIKPKVKKSKKE